jgi:hypothetical protein
VASRCPWRPSRSAARVSLSTSAGVRYSRLRRSAFRGLRGGFGLLSSRLSRKRVSEPPNATATTRSFCGRGSPALSRKGAFSGMSAAPKSTAGKLALLVLFVVMVVQWAWMTMFLAPMLAPRHSAHLAHVVRCPASLLAGQLISSAKRNADPAGATRKVRHPAAVASSWASTSSALAIR